MLISHRTSRLLAAGTLVLGAAVLSSCGTEEATDKLYTPAAGSNHRDGRVDVLNAAIVSTTPGRGTFVTTLVSNELEKPGDAAGSADDRLVGLAVDGQQVRLRKPVAVAAGGITVLATTNEAILEAQPGIRVTGDFEAGEFVEVVLTFANAGEVTLEVPVHANIEGGSFEGQDGDASTAPAEEQGHDDHAEDETTEPETEAH